MGGLRSSVAYGAVVAAIAACSGPSESSTQQAVDMSGSGMTFSGSVGSDVLPTIMEYGTETVTLAFTPATGTDDYYVLGLEGSSVCGDFALSASNGPLGPGGGSARVFWATGSDCMTQDPSGSGFLCDYKFNVTFSPTVPGTASCSYKFDYENASSSGSGTGFNISCPVGAVCSTVQLDLSSFATQATGVVLSATPNPLKLTVPGGGTGSGTVTVTNSGSAGSFTPSLPTGTNFGVMPNATTSIGSGSAVPLTVTCTDPGGSTTLSLLPSAGGTGSAVTLDCSVAVSNGLNISPLTVQFPGTTLVGTNAPGPQPVTLTGGIGNAAVTLALDGSAQGNGVTGSVAGAGTIPAAGSAYSLSSSGALSVNLQWQPTQLANGSLGTLGVTYNGTQTSVQINGTAATATILTYPSRIDFGAFCSGSAVPPATLDVYNVGGADVTLETEAVGSPFGIPNAGSATLKHQRLNDDNLMVTLTANSPGPYSDSITLMPQVGSAVTVPVTAAVAQGGGVSATPNGLQFGSIKNETLSTLQTFQLTNCGSGPVSISNAQIVGPDASEFNLEIQPTGSGSDLAIASSASYSVIMAPHTPGLKTAHVAVTLVGGTSVDVPLSGTSLGNNRDTYYACSSGGGAGGWPIVAAIGGFVFVRRRRRA